MTRLTLSNSGKTITVSLDILTYEEMQRAMPVSTLRFEVDYADGQIRLQLNTSESGSGYKLSPPSSYRSSSPTSQPGMASFSLHSRYCKDWPLHGKIVLTEADPAVKRFLGSGNLRYKLPRQLPKPKVRLRVKRMEIVRSTSKEIVPVSTSVDLSTGNLLIGFKERQYLFSVPEGEVLDLLMGYSQRGLLIKTGESIRPDTRQT